MNWNLAHIEQLAAAGKITGFKVAAAKAPHVPDTNVGKTGKQKKMPLNLADLQKIAHDPHRYEVLIGIDTGTHTGFATYSTISRKLLTVETLPIHQAMERVLSISQTFKIKVRFEDARLRKMFGKSGREKLQGAGSIKRDAVIWQDYLTDKGIAFEPVAPKDNKTKLTAAQFLRMTGWEGRTNEHGRDAAMLVHGY